jgi:hypothetical protein
MLFLALQVAGEEGWVEVLLVHSTRFVQRLSLL